MTEAEKFEAWLGRLGREYDERNVYGVTWVGTPNAMPRYRGQWTEGLWLGWQARAALSLPDVQPALASAIGRLSSPQPAPIPAPEAPTNAWKDAVIDACVVNWIEWDVNDPRKSVATLVEASIKIALDPDVSEQAQALVDHGKSLAAPEAQPSSTEGGAQPSEREAFDAVVSYQSDPKGLALDYWRAAVAWARGSAAHPLPVAVEPAGWKLVPIEPTVEMRNAFHAVSDTLVLGAAGTHWAAMLAASPAPPEQPPT